MCGAAASRTPRVLTPEQLTGRSATHIVSVAQPACRLHPRAAAAFAALAQEAADSGIDLAASSSFRDFARQLSIWNDKFEGRRALLDAHGQALDVQRMAPEAIVRAILAWSALPGASRHHWGTDLDVFDRAALPAGGQPRLLPAEYAPGGVFAALARFLEGRAAHHGFFRPYDVDRGGVQPEPWHLSFAPVACEALPRLTPAVLAEALATATLAGAEVIARLLPEIHERYVCRVAYWPSQAFFK